MLMFCQPEDYLARAIFQPLGMELARWIEAMTQPAWILFRRRHQTNPAFLALPMSLLLLFWISIFLRRQNGGNLEI